MHGCPDVLPLTTPSESTLLLSIGDSYIHNGSPVAASSAQRRPVTEYFIIAFFLSPLIVNSVSTVFQAVSACTISLGTV